MGSIIVPIGITTIICLITTAVLGLRAVKMDVKKRRKLHITMAVVTLVLAATHGGLVLYLELLR